jgi:hypothetical protein
MYTGSPSSPGDRSRTPGTTATASSPAAWEDDLIPHSVRAEANLLRLPLFALHTKRLKTLDGIECSGRITRSGETHQFWFRATRNTATLYPGPLARAAHLAFLSIITEHGTPLHNPITWRWRDLCRRMRIACGGLTVRHLKEAILSTAGLLIHSEYALYSKPDGQPICTRQDGLHLYERVSFLGSQLPDGNRADTNYLWLSDWYLNNLNAMFTAPLDYSLWQFLDHHSPIASRLYEFLLLNFYSGSPVLRINYETLAKFLPVRPERYRSRARQQLEPAFKLLRATKVLKETAWAKSKAGLAQLHLYRGATLSLTGDPAQIGFRLLEEDFAEGMEVKELRNLKGPEWTLVTDFYQLWAGNTNSRPTSKELEQAAELIAQHGQAKARALIPLVVKRLKEKWPDAKSFGAIARYLPVVAGEYDRQQWNLEKRKQEQLQEQQEWEEAARKAKERAALQAVWETLPQEEREGIRTLVLAGQPQSLAKHPGLVDKLCLTELAKRRSEPAS